MNIDEKVRKTLRELGVTDVPGVHALFDEVRCVFSVEAGEVRSKSLEPAFEETYQTLHNRWLGRKQGLIKMHIRQRWLNTSPETLKLFVGRDFNELNDFATAQLEDLRSARERRQKALAQWEAGEPKFESDLTLPGYRHAAGSIHPVTRVRREIEDIYLGLGFRIETGPEIESAYYNFDALNIPETHPSRDDWDTLYVDLPAQPADAKNSKTLLRTHTSPVQIRAMERSGAPLYIIVPGKVYRHDNPDSSHATMFHQIEGLAVDRDITFADLKGTLDFFAKKFFGEKIRTSFHPSFFPFTEPSGEVAINCTICDGQGCAVCKMSGWVEVMGCGMVHPQVLENCGIDSSKFAGWAFGLGLERYTMMKYGINDIQLFFQSDLRFLGQF